MRVTFDESCLKQEQITSNHEVILNFILSMKQIYGHLIYTVNLYY